MLIYDEKIEVAKTRTRDLSMKQFVIMSKINLLSVLISNCYHSRLKLNIQYLQCRLKSTSTLSNSIDLKRIFNKKFEKTFFIKPGSHPIIRSIGLVILPSFSTDRL